MRTEEMKADAEREGAAFRTATNDLDGRLFIDVFSESEPSFAGLLDLSRAAAYAEIARGTWPVVRSGKRIRIHVPSLLAAVKP